MTKITDGRKTVNVHCTWTTTPNDRAGSDLTRDLLAPDIARGAIVDDGDTLRLVAQTLAEVEDYLADWSQALDDETAALALDADELRLEAARRQVWYE